jgi:membrane protease subunit (stomatin/prohibitin family)
MSDLTTEVKEEIQEPSAQKEIKDKKEFDIEDIKKQIMTEFDKKYKTEISGLNKKVSELTKEKMTTEERAAYEIKQKDEELREYKTKVIGTTKKEALIQAGVDPRYSRFITGDSEDDILESVTALAELLAEDRGKVKSDILYSTAKKPESGLSVDTISLEKFNQMNQTQKAEWTKKNPEEWTRLREQMLKKK